MIPDVAQLLGTLGLPGLLALAFGGGVLLSLTPCVYPMIPITVAAFGARSVSRPRAFGLSLLYVLGIVTMYSSLGVWAASTGHLFGSLLADPRVTGSFGGFFALLAAISFGWLPAIESWLSRTPTRVAQLGGASPGGAYVMGLVAGILFAPCVGPVVVGILGYVATSGDIFLGGTLLGASALGMGLPFVAIATLANEAARVPKLTAFLPLSRLLFGLLLLAAATYYLSLAVPETFEQVILLAALGTAVLSAWRLVATSRRLRWVVLSLGVGTFALGLAYSSRSGESPSELAWRTDVDIALAEAQQEHRYAIVDFTADWCLVCRELDSQTFQEPNVAALLNKMVRIRIDATTIDDRIDSFFWRFGVLGLPNVVLIDPQGQVVESARVVSFVLPKDYVKILQGAGLRITR